jgi:predicted DCC family thiol-disulfide oxidoreductase YuxK
MWQRVQQWFQSAYQQQVPATGLALFRLFFGLVVVQEIAFLFYFRHLIFDLTPFLDRVSTLLHVFLVIWGVSAVFLTVGYKTRINAVLNYLFWIVVLVFTSMWEDFDGGFDQLMIGSSLLLIFLPSERALSLDNLVLRLRHFQPHKKQPDLHTVSLLCYLIPVMFSLGLLYFDSAIHKLFAEHWRNGLGAWLPSTMPYYISAFDASWLLNQQYLMQTAGYTILVFQFVFPFLFFRCWARIPLLLLGVGFHLGITLFLNIYPFGLGMLAHYCLLVPFAWWRTGGTILRYRAQPLKVFYDEQCPLCRRTVAVLQHFDIVQALEFKGLQSYAQNYSQLAKIDESVLLTDLYALDQQNKLHQGFDTYLQILKTMRYPAALAWLLSLPGLYHLGRWVYRRVADNRSRKLCDDTCLPSINQAQDSALVSAIHAFAPKPKIAAKRLAKVSVFILLLQLNVTLVHGLLHRIPNNFEHSPAGQLMLPMSGALALFSHGFLGITPHALYLHDHFEGYHHILAFTWVDANGKEQWLPFINQQGRMLSPNWGRVHSMWANIGLSARIVPWRVKKAIRRITAYWCTELGLGLEDTTIIVKMKKIRSPVHWEKDLRKHNLSGTWVNIGIATWKNNEFQVDLPDIEAL